MRLTAEQRAGLIGDHPTLSRAAALRLSGPQPLTGQAVARFAEGTRQEIADSINRFQVLAAVAKESFIFRSLSFASRLFTDTRDPVFWDQALWEAIDTPRPAIVEGIVNSLEHAPTAENRISAVLALVHSAHLDASRAADVLESLSEDTTEIELAEWATLCLREMVSIATNDRTQLDEAVSSRPFNYDPSLRFDVVLPLMFAGYAFTEVGGITKRTVISPLWFYRIFGRANALVRLETLDSQLVIEKRMEGINPDGSPHFEVFPFAGETDALGPNARHHNYWAELKRPFYSSGRTGVVGEGQHVVLGVPMTFVRVAETLSPARYAVGGGVLVETTRGLFGGHGHVDPLLLLKNRFDLKPGEFQLSSVLNPITGDPANTEFYGSFYGKVSDWDGDGHLDFNSLPIHSTTNGRVDYDGDGTGARTTLRPEDWLE